MNTDKKGGINGFTAISNHTRYILAPSLLAGRVGGGVLVPGEMTICCKQKLLQSNSESF